MINEVEIQVRFAETDAMGVVYHANYLPWFEIGRYDFLDKFCENSKKEIRWGEYYLPVVNAECKYIEFVKFGETVVISTYLVKTDQAKVCFVSEVRKKGSKKVVARGYTEHVFLDKDYKMLFALPEFIRKDIQNIEACYPQYLKDSKGSRR